MVDEGALAGEGELGDRRQEFLPLEAGAEKLLIERFGSREQLLKMENLERLEVPGLLQQRERGPIDLGGQRRTGIGIGEQGLQVDEVALEDSGPGERSAAAM